MLASNIAECDDTRVNDVVDFRFDTNARPGIPITSESPIVSILTTDGSSWTFAQRVQDVSLMTWNVIDRKSINLAAQVFLSSRELFVKRLSSVIGLDPNLVSRRDSLRTSLSALVDKGFFKSEDMSEIMQQEVIFENWRARKGNGFIGKTIVVCGGEVFVGDTLVEAVRKSKEKFGDKPYYTESLEPIIEFPSTYEM
jgi:hypothetical protein